MSIKLGKTRQKRQGFILILTLFTALMLGTLVVGFLLLTAIDLNLVRNHKYSLQAYYVAEAGIVDAIDKIQRNELTIHGDEWYEWEDDFPQGASSSYNVAVVPGPTNVITSTGFVPAANFSRTLEVHVKVVSESEYPPFKVSIKHFKEVIQ